MDTKDPSGVVQTYSNLGLLIGLGVVSALGFFRKLPFITGGSKDKSASSDEWFPKLYTATMDNGAALRQIVEMMKARDIREENERAYERGRRDQGSHRPAPK